VLITDPKKLITTAIIFFLVACNSESTSEKKLRLTVDAGEIQKVPEYNDVTLSAIVVDDDQQLQSVSWAQTAGTEVDLVTEGTEAFFTVPEVKSDERATFQVSITTKNKDTIKDDVNVVFLDSEPLISQNLPNTNIVPSGSPINVKLNGTAPNTRYEWDVSNKNGSTTEINIINESNIEILPTTTGDFILKISADNSFRTESSLINFNVIEPWMIEFEDSINHLPNFVKSDSSYVFELTPAIPSTYNVRWFHNDEEISHNRDISLTLDTLGRHKVTLIVYNGGEELRSKSWFLDIFKRQNIEPESIVHDGRTITVSENGSSSLSGLSIILPESSKYKNEEISIAANHIGDSSYSFSLTPEGAQFSQPVSISFPKSAFLDIEQNAYIRHTDKGMNYGEVIKAKVEDETVTFEAAHFSNFELTTGAGSLSAIDDLSTYNEIFAEDLSQSYLLFKGVYNDVNKAYLAADTSSSLLTTSTLLLDVKRIKENADLLKNTLSNKRLIDVIESIERPASYWVERGIKGNYGSVQHAASIKKAQDLLKVLNSYEEVLKNLPANIKLSDLDTTKLGQVRTSLDKVGNVLQPLFVSIDTAFAVWEISKGDFLAASKSSVNAFSGGLQIYLGSAYFTKGRLALANGPKPGPLIAGLISTHVLQEFVLDPYVYEPSTDFIDYINLYALTELSRLNDATWNEFKSKIQVVKSGSGDDDLTDFTDLEGIYDEFNNTVNENYKLASELRREVINRYNQIKFKTKFANIAYINFEELYMRSLDIHEWQLERIQRLINKASSLVEKVKLIREDVINSVVENSSPDFSFTSVDTSLKNNVVNIDWETKGIAHEIAVKIKVNDNSFTLATLDHQRSKMSYKLDIQDIGLRFGKYESYELIIVAKERSGDLLAENVSNFTVPNSFWSEQNNKPEFLSHPDIDINISNFIRNSLLLEEEPQDYFSDTIFGFFVKKELDGLRVIDKDGDFLALDFNIQSPLNALGIDYSNGSCPTEPPISIDLASSTDLAFYQKCKSDTVNNLPSIAFQRFSNENYHVNEPKNPKMPAGFFGSLCQGENPFNYRNLQLSSSRINATFKDWKISEKEESKKQPWEPDLNTEVLSNSDISYSFRIDTEYDMPIHIGSSNPRFNSGDYDSNLTFTDNISGSELFGEGEYLLLTLTLSACNRDGAVKKLSTLENTVEFKAFLDREIFLERASEIGLEIIKIIAVKTRGSYEILGYSSVEIPPSSFASNGGQPSDGDVIIILPDDTGPGN